MVLIQSISVYSLPVVLGEEVKNISIVTALEMYGGLKSVHLTYAVNMLLIKKRMFRHIVVAVQLQSRVQIFVTPWTVAHQTSLSMGFPRQEYWNAWPFPSPGLGVFSSVQFIRLIVSYSLRPHESQHARPPCPSPTPGVHSNSRPSSRWCHPAISSSVVPFSSCPQSLAASGSFPMSQLFPWGGQSTGVFK